MSVVRDGELGLPMESVYPEEVAGLRLRKLTLAEVSCLAETHDSAANAQSARFQLMPLVAQLACHRGVDQLLIAVHPRHARFYQRFMGFDVLGEERRYEQASGKPAGGFRPATSTAGVRIIHASINGCLENPSPMRYCGTAPSPGICWSLVLPGSRGPLTRPSGSRTVLSSWAWIAPVPGALLAWPRSNARWEKRTAREFLAPCRAPCTHVSWSGKRAAIACADSGRRAGFFSRHSQIARSRAGSISGHRTEGEKPVWQRFCGPRRVTRRRVPFPWPLRRAQAPARRGRSVSRAACRETDPGAMNAGVPAKGISAPCRAPCTHGVLTAVGTKAAMPKSANVDVTVAVDHDIGRLQVPMQDVMICARAQRRRKVPGRSARSSHVRASGAAEQ